MQDNNCLDFEFSTIFRDFDGNQVAGTWLDPASGLWAVSTIPIQRFPTEQQAIEFFTLHCDPNTGLRDRWSKSLHSKIEQRRN